MWSDGNGPTVNPQTLRTMSLLGMCLVRSEDGNESDLRRIRFGYYLLLYFNLNMNTDLDIFEYEYKTGILD
jgi:hypothetical protein